MQCPSCRSRTGNRLSSILRKGLLKSALLSLSPVQHQYYMDGGGS